VKSILSAKPMKLRLFILRLSFCSVFEDMENFDLFLSKKTLIKCAASSISMISQLGLARISWARSMNSFEVVRHLFTPCSRTEWTKLPSATISQEVIFSSGMLYLYLYSYFFWQFSKRRREEGEKVICF